MALSPIEVVPVHISGGSQGSMTWMVSPLGYSSVPLPIGTPTRWNHSALPDGAAILTLAESRRTYVRRFSGSMLNILASASDIWASVWKSRPAAWLHLDPR